MKEREKELYLIKYFNIRKYIFMKFYKEYNNVYVHFLININIIEINNNKHILFDIEKINVKDVLLNNNVFFVFVDIERTNGIFIDDYNAIFQLAFKIIGTNNIYQTYCKPDDTISWKKHVMVKKEIANNGPPLKYVIINFFDFIYKISEMFNCKPIFISHNKSYDKNILKHCLKYYNLNIDIPNWCDTKYQFFYLRDENNKLIYKLDDLIDKLKIKRDMERHIAANDIEYLHKCLLKIYHNNEKLSNLIIKIVNKELKNKIYKNMTKRYNIIINKYETYKINKCIKIFKNNDITKTTFYHIKMEGEKYFKRKYSDRINDFLNIDDNYFIINSKITPEEIIKLSYEEYNELIKLLIKYFGVKNIDK